MTSPASQHAADGTPVAILHVDDDPDLLELTKTSSR